ncbi:hypothetical protein RJ640_003626 [Escallonia rubra]|uniref:Uncharacterized protein n=1 Tax=Escallonia rubra TaxID=112253 RepID=A0AA88U2N5_9ASTE|nr:hypothetical protein RJ640_003626 [Escallonia rubra]
MATTMALTTSSSSSKGRGADATTGPTTFLCLGKGAATQGAKRVSSLRVDEVIDVFLVVHGRFLALDSSMPASLGNLKDLIYFNISSNFMSGLVPYEIASLKKLQSSKFAYLLWYAATGLMMVLGVLAKRIGPRTEELGLKVVWLRLVVTVVWAGLWL